MNDERNNTNFTTDLLRDIKSIDFESEKSLRKWQVITKEYIINRHKVENHTGLLIYHEMGYGKTRIAVSIIHALGKERPLIGLMTKNLQSNFDKEINAYKEQTGDNTELNYNYITINASNMFKKVKEITGGNLNGYTVIIDEAHDFFNSITNESTTNNALNLYKAILDAKDIIVIFLTGQVIVNDAFELVACFNMLNGYNYNKRDKHTLFPEEYSQFNNLFIEMKDGKSYLKNREKFQDRITGLVSYYGNKLLTKIGKDGIIKKDGFPDKYPIEVVSCEMSDYQFASYEIEYIKEQQTNNLAGPSSNKSALEQITKIKEHGKFSAKSKTRMAKPQNIGASYKPGTRQLSNFATIQKDFDKKEALTKNLRTYSNKYYTLINNLNKNPERLKLVYSFYVENGIKLIAQILKLNGWNEYNVNVVDHTIITKKTNKQSEEITGGNIINEIDYDSIDKNMFKLAHKIQYGGMRSNRYGGMGNSKKNKTIPKTEKVKGLTFALYLAEDPPEIRQSILKDFNSEENKYGKIINVILISKAAAQGTDFKRIREIHITEPYWNYGLIEQIEARGVRLNSHMDMKPDERNVKSYIYLSTYKDHDTTDIELWRKSLDKYSINNQFLDALIESSIECGMFNQNDDIKCRLCTPTNQPLYYNDVYVDINTESKCKPIEEETIEAEELIVDKIKYYFTKNPTIIYKYDSNLNNYRQLMETTAEYEKISSLIK